MVRTSSDSGITRRSSRRPRSSCALKNNVVWVVLFPFLVTFFGLVFAVLTERIRWSTAFKTIVFMPLVFSATAAGLTWASIFFIDPHTGMVNAAIQGAANAINPPGLYPIDPSAAVRPCPASPQRGSQPGPAAPSRARRRSAPGSTVRARADRHQLRAHCRRTEPLPAVAPTASSGAITGLVWRDFSPTHPMVRGQVFPDEDGIPGCISRC